jgi:hypothetical protein
VDGEEIVMTTTSRVAESDNAPGDLTALENTLKTATAQPAAPQGDVKQPDSTVTKPEYIQDKFWTGNLEESLRKQAEAYVPLQSQYGRMANDLGQQRKLTDRLILGLDKQNPNGTPAPVKAAVKVTARDLVDKPAETIEAVVNARLEAERTERERQEAQSMMESAEQAFMSNHPDYATIASGTEFTKWVQASPSRKIAARAAAQGDYSAADGLLTEFKAGQVSATKTDDTAGARAAGLETAAQAGGTSGGNKPIYRRADLIRLKMEKPEVYGDPKFQAEIMQAYAEKRVK